MSVTIAKVQEFTLNQPDPGVMEPSSKDVRFNNVHLEDGNIRHGVQEVPDMKIQGEVVEVMGTDVRIKLTSHGDLKVGFVADLTYVTSSGIELPVGTWRVTSIDRREVGTVRD